MYPSEPALLYDPIRYIMDGGKRLRSEFLMRSCGLFSDPASDSGEALTSAEAAAEAVEMFHNFTLLHDDIMDNASLRRGRESVYAKWGGNVAILSGDALMILAYRRLSAVESRLLPAVLRHFNEAALRVCEGQRLDMDFEADYLSMIERKTAALFVGAVSMGAVVGGASCEDLERLREFALQFGIAFQIQDDLLDAYGDARLGKTVGGDIVEGKKTFLALQVPSDELGFEAASPEEKIERVMAIYNRYGVREKAESEISRRFSLALAALDSLSVAGERVEKFKLFAMAQLGRAK